MALSNSKSRNIVYLNFPAAGCRVREKVHPNFTANSILHAAAPELSCELPCRESGHVNNCRCVRKTEHAYAGVSQHSATSMRILIADDNSLVRAAMRELLRTDTDCLVCGEAASGPQTLEKARELRPDLIILDFSMPAPNGFEVTRLIRQEFPDVKILIVSAQDVDNLLPSALLAGADGCLDKTDLGRQLIRAIKAFHRGEANSPSPVKLEH